MNIRIITKDRSDQADIAVITSDEVIIKNAQDALDLIVMIYYDHGCEKMILNKESISEDFFSLKNGLAGDIMQKFINYGMALAIVGDFACYASESLKSLIYESNQGKRILFKETELAALQAFN